jgi:hypothetical protein
MILDPRRPDILLWLSRQSGPEQQILSVVCPPGQRPLSNSHSTGTSAGAPLFLIKNTRNFAGLVLLAFRSMR